MGRSGPWPTVWRPVGIAMGTVATTHSFLDEMSGSFLAEGTASTTHSFLDETSGSFLAESRAGC